MTIEEKVRQIMLSEELPDEKLDRLHALTPGARSGLSDGK